MTLIEFECGGHRYALPLTYARRVVSSAQPTPLPGAPEIVLGVLNLDGEVVTIVNFFHRVGLPFSRIELSQQLLLVDISEICIGLVVDRVRGIVTHEIKDQPNITGPLAGAEFVQTIRQLDDGLCIIFDPERFLLNDEKISIGRALDHLHHVEH